VVSLAILVGGFNAFFILWFSKGEQFAAYMKLNAEVTAAIIRALGDGADVHEMVIMGERYTLNLKRGCDALQAAAFYICAVLTSPVGIALRRRIVPVIVGTALLLAINLIRLLSLYYTGVFFPEWFDFMHVEFWQSVFIFIPIVLWLFWLFRAMRRAARSNASR
jgi:exosortase/archaeosortase family protein